ncbi:alpha/beta fold hydrolase [Dokdonella sp.]|uniref:alpha/beta fold hydrolase n=1 Tax=Dokdonella sp. TaxID=2291710 RepID=UPI0035274015
MSALSRKIDYQDVATTSARPGSFVTDDGIRVSFFRWGTDDTRIPVTLHHGFAASTEANWVGTGVVAALLAAGRSVISIDARGHGQSDKPHDADRYGEARMARDLVGLLDHLEVGEFDLFGYSMGAIVSLIVASEDTRLRHLIVGGIGEGVLATGGVDLRVMDRDAVVAAMLTDDPSTIAAPDVAAFRLFAESTGCDLKALAAQASRMFDQVIPLNRIAAACLVLAGEKDTLAIHPEQLAAAIPRGRCIKVPGDHLGAVRQPQFIAAALEFLGH